jgi:prophage antirepressor-like protein
MLRSRFDILKGVYMRIENWYGHDIRFVEINGEWYAILKDICNALKLRTKDVSQRISPDMLERVNVASKVDIPSKYNSSDDITKDEDGLTDVVFNTFDKSYWMLAVNEAGIYQALFASRKLEARKFQLWTFDILKKLRKNVGLQGYEVMRMTEPDIQEQIDWILDSLYWDEERGCLMESYTVAGGDVEQRPFDVNEEE